MMQSGTRDWNANAEGRLFLGTWYYPKRNSMPANEARTILVVESDILLRHVLAESLRGCGFEVIEAASAIEARTMIQKGPAVHILLSDARLAGPEGGFALAQWARRYRPEMNIILTSTLANKSRAVSEICGQRRTASTDNLVRDRMNAIRARRKGPPPRSRAEG